VFVHTTEALRAENRSHRIIDGGRGRRWGDSA